MRLLLYDVKDEYLYLNTIEDLEVLITKLKKMVTLGETRTNHILVQDANSHKHVILNMKKDRDICYGRK